MSKAVQTVSSGQVRRRTLISMAVFLCLLFLGFLGWRWLYNSKPTADDPAIRGPLRVMHQFNERVYRHFFSADHQAKSYPKSAAAKEARVNGAVGLDGVTDTASWRLKIARGAGDTLLLSLADIQKLPKTEVIFDFKCIEGWDQVSHWGGVRLKDFLAYYHLPENYAYMGLVTPDKGYYVGIDMPSALHPQTLLCYELNGRPLPQNQGFPLRLIIPVKYGIKHLKRIGTMYFSNTPPPDYWAEQGYDYYSGL